MRRQPQQGNADRVLVVIEQKFWQNVCHMAIKVFRSTFTTAMCKCTIKTLLDDSNLNDFQTLWPRLNILRLVDVPQIIDDCNFRSADSCASLSNFIQLSLRTVRMPCDFPLAVVFAAWTSGRFVILMIYRISKYTSIPNLIKQLFNSCLLDMRLVIANSCPTRALME